MKNRMKQSFQNLYSAAQKGINGLKGLWNDWTGNTQIDKQLAAQEKENAEMRDYNLKLAKMQNQWNIAQWERENAYNSPSAQKARLEAAGLNADMMYGQGGVVNTSSPSPSLSAGAPASPMDWSSLANKKSVGQAAFEAAQLDNLRAVTDKIKAETQGQEHSNDILESDALFRQSWNEGLLKKQDVEIKLLGSQSNLNDENVSLVRQQVKQAFASTEQLQKSLSVIDAQISNLNADTAYKQVKAVIDKELSDSQIKSMAAKSNLDYAQAKRILDELPYLITRYKDEHGMMLLQGAHLTKQGNLLQLQVDRESNNPRHNGGFWKHIYQGVDFVNDVVEAISPVIGQSPSTINHNTTQYLQK